MSRPVWEQANLNTKESLKLNEILYIFILQTKGKSELFVAFKENKEEKFDDGFLEMGVIKYETKKTEKENNL